MAGSRPARPTQEEGAERPATLRRARASDLPAVLGLLRDSGLPSAGVEESFGSFLVAETKGRLVGVAGLEVHGPDGVLRSVAVHSDSRGGGLGSRLTEESLNVAREEGLRQVYLLTETAEDFFPRFGFRRIDRSDASPEVQESVEFREACPASAVALVREL